MKYNIVRLVHGQGEDTMHSFYNQIEATDKLQGIYDDLEKTNVGKFVDTSGRPMQSFTYEVGNERITFAVEIVPM